MSFRVLVLSHLKSFAESRKSIYDHLLSFKRYTKGVEYHYFSAENGIPLCLSWIHYDVVILHYTFLSMRWDWKNFPHFMERVDNLRYINAPKVALPQDEYAHTHDLWKMFKTFGVETVFTLADKRAYSILYPLKKSGLKYRFTVFPGYVDELTLTKIGKWASEQSFRPIDIGYRARVVPYWVGRHAQKKAELATVVETYCQRHTNLVIDISTKQEAVLEGEQWIRFLLSSKAVLGCEAGATLWDPKGSIRRCVESYVSDHPDATFDEAERACFSGKDGKLPYITISPRIFEAAMTKTCQILVEGRYAGILKPNVHYIPLKANYSNLPEVIAKIQDEQYRQRIVDTCYRDLVLSGKYTYRVFANQVIDHLHKVGGHRRTKHASWLTALIFPAIPYGMSFYQGFLSFRLQIKNFRILYRFRRFLNRTFFRLVILPGSTIKQEMIRRKLWPN